MKTLQAAEPSMIIHPVHQPIRFFPFTPSAFDILRTQALQIPTPFPAMFLQFLEYSPFKNPIKRGSIERSSLLYGAQLGNLFCNLCLHITHLVRDGFCSIEYDIEDVDPTLIVHVARHDSLKMFERQFQRVDHRVRVFFVDDSQIIGSQTIGSAIIW